MHAERQRLRVEMEKTQSPCRPISVEFASSPFAVGGTFRVEFRPTLGLGFKHVRRVGMFSR